MSLNKNLPAGGYAFLDVGGEDLAGGSRGMLVSPPISATSGACLAFSYVLDGLHELNVMVEVRNGNLGGNVFVSVDCAHFFMITQ